MSKVSKNKEINVRKKKSESLQQKIDAAQAKKAKMLAESTLDPVTVSPASNMTTTYTIAGIILRAVVIFLGVFGLNLFLFDAIRIVIPSGTDAGNIVISVVYVLLVSFFVTIVCALMSLHRFVRPFTPIVVIGGLAAYVFSSQSNPVGFIIQSGRRFMDLICENMRDAGYTTYMKYVSGMSFSFDETELVEFAAACIIAVSGIVIGMALSKRVNAAAVVIVCAVYMVPVFMFNITRTNTGLALTLAFICGAVALYLFDGLYGGIFAGKKAKKEAKKQAKLDKKSAKKQKKAARHELKNNAVLAYSNALSAGMSRKSAKKARDAVYAKDKNSRKDAVKDEKLRLKEQKQAKKDAKKIIRDEKKAAKLRKKEERAKLRAKVSAAKKSKNTEELAKIAEMRKEAKRDAGEIKRSNRKKEVDEIKTIAAGGFAGGMAVVIAFLALWIPLMVVSKNFPIIDVINNKMQLARTYVTAYLMGDDIDLNSLAMYGGVDELNPRTVNFNTPQYTGQMLFKVDATYMAPVYLRSWIGTGYDLETDTWTSADYDTVTEYRQRFGSSYTPDNISYYFNKYVYPNALDIQKVNQYRNLDEFGFRVFQVHVQRVSGTSRILFVPSIMNTGLGVMNFNSLDKSDMKYSAYFDGIYSSRFFEEGSSYSVSSYNPVMKNKNVGENYEGSIRYYNLAKDYIDAIDIIEEEIKSEILFREDKEYTYETPIGPISMTGTDPTFLCGMFEEDIAEFGYKYEVQSLVEMYLNMSDSERNLFKNSFNFELNYRDYTESYYTVSFGSEKIAALADEILAEAGIVQGEKQLIDKTQFDEMSEKKYERLSAVEKYGNYYESWFTDAETGETVPRHDAVMAVINFLRDNYTYTLDPNCPQTELLDEDGNFVLDGDGNPIMVDYIEADSNLEAFLFDVKEGYCVHFATSAAAILREMGFAVRYDEGYIASKFARTYDREAAANYRSNVRDYDAHAWIEIYYPSLGWIMYECTPSFCEDIYDTNVITSSSSGGIDSSKITVKEPEPEEKEEFVNPFANKEDEIDFTPIIIALGVIVLAAAIICAIREILKSRAKRAILKRAKLIDTAKNEEKFISGETDVHQTARDIIDCIFDIFSALGCSPETGELPTEYAVRIDEDYANISKHRTADVMNIIEKEEFGGDLKFRELVTLAEYLGEIQSSVYASLSLRDKLRMRYLMNVL